MQTSENGLNYDADGFLIGINSINDKAVNIDTDLKEVISLIRKQQKFEPSVINLGEMATQNNKINHALASLKITNNVTNSIHVENTNTVIGAVTHVIDLSSSYNGENKPTQPIKNKSNGNDSKIISLNHEADNIVKGLKEIGENAERIPEHQKKELNEVRKSLKPVSEMAENTVSPLSGIEKMQKRGEPISRDQKSFNDDEETALNDISRQTGKNISLKQMVSSIPMIALAVGGAFVLAVKKWWNDRNGTKSSTITTTDAQAKGIKKSTDSKNPASTSNTSTDNNSNNKDSKSSDVSKNASQDGISKPSDTTETAPKDSNDQIATVTNTTGSDQQGKNLGSLDTVQNVTNASPVATPSLDIPRNGQTPSINSAVQNIKNISSTINGVPSVDGMTSPIDINIPFSLNSDNQSSENLVNSLANPSATNSTVINAITSGASNAVLADQGADSILNATSNNLMTMVQNNQSNLFTNTDKIQSIISADSTNYQSQPQQISIQNASMDTPEPKDRLLVHAVSENISNALHG